MSSPPLVGGKIQSSPLDRTNLTHTGLLIEGLGPVSKSMCGREYPAHERDGALTELPGADSPDGPRDSANRQRNPDEHPESEAAAIRQLELPTFQSPAHRFSGRGRQRSALALPSSGMSEWWRRGRPRPSPCRRATF